jgi:hypothetical protein
MTAKVSMARSCQFVSLEPRIQTKVVDWHGKDAEGRCDQFAKYGGAYDKGFF